MIVQCNQCGKKFNAGDGMAGKRVRCRGCGQVFQVGLTDADPTPSPQAATDIKRALDMLANPSLGSAGDFFSAAPDDAPAFIGRDNVPLHYAYSRMVDTYVPVAFLVISAVWVLAEMIRQSEMAPWVPVLRIAVFWVIYAGVVWTITLAGSTRAARKAAVRPPPRHAWRVFATFSFPAALAYILWTLGGGIAGFVSGAVVGMGVALACHFLLFRYRPSEAGQALPIVALYHGAALVAGLFTLIALNFAVMQIVSASRAGQQFENSPMGHYLAWKPIVAVPDEKPAAKVIVRKPDVGPSEIAAKPPLAVVPPPVAPPSAPLPTVASPVVVPPVVSPSSPAVAPMATAREPVKPGASEVFPNPADAFKPVAATAAAPAAPTHVAPSPVTPAPRRSLFDDEESPPAANRTPTFAPEVEEKPIDRAITSPLISKITDLTDVGTFGEAILPVMPSRAVAVLRRASADEDSLDVWDIGLRKKTGSAIFRHEAGIDPSYQLSPDGKIITRIAAFPSLSLQVWSVAEERVIRSISLIKSNGTPTAIGFGDGSSLWILWELSGQFGIEGFDVQTGQRLRQFVLSSYERSPGNLRISPDGKFVAVMRPAKPGTQGELQVFNLRSGLVTRRFPINSIDRDLLVQPAGIAFSPDMTRLAMILEHHDQGLLLAWNLTGSDTKPIHEHLFPSGFAGDKAGRMRAGRAFDWLSNGSGWLVNGTGIYDSATGKLLGDLGIGHVSAQRMVDASTIELVLSVGDASAPARPMISSMCVVTLKSPVP